MKNDLIERRTTMTKPQYTDGDPAMTFHSDQLREAFCYDDCAAVRWTAADVLDIAHEIITLVWVRGESIYDVRVQKLVEDYNGRAGGND